MLILAYSAFLVFLSPQDAEGIVMSIPMPGHAMTSQEEKSVVDDCNCLHNLVDSHDAVFLLTDTRESRWLPTLLSANANKVSLLRLICVPITVLVIVFASSFIKHVALIASIC
jgi:hypothetical protein